MGTSFLLLYMSFLLVLTRGLANEPSNLVKRFTEKELTETFGVNDPVNVPIHERTKVHGNIKLNDNTPTSLSLEAFGKNFQLNVSPNKDFISDTHTTEFIDKDGNINKYVGVLGEFSFGNVANDPRSHVSLHHTGKGLIGSIRTSDDLYIINPLPHRHRIEEDDEEADHVIYRASDNLHDDIIKKIMTTERDLRENDEVHRRTRRSLRDDLPKKTIELLVAGDYKMLALHGKEFMPVYMLAIINMMAGYFKDVSLEYPVDIVVVKSVIFETDIMKAKNMDTLLTAFTGWCNKNNNFDDTSKDHFDTALLLSKDGCSEGCGIVGLANYNAACSKNSQAVGMDRGFMTSVIIAHELGHVLGSGHDGTGGSKDCPNGINIMASGGTGGGVASIKWSTCSSSHIAKTLRAATCYDDLPQAKALTDSTFQLFGTVYNSDRQCELQYGKGFQRCIYKEDLCKAMTCNKIGTGSCVSRLFPALHGTSCGQDKWCIFGVCVPNGGRKARLEKRVDGGWSQWSEYTNCTKSCNVGVQWRTRTCTDPKPIYDGSLCKTKKGELAEEEPGHYRTCNQQRCEANTAPEDLFYSDRDAQCRKVKTGSDFCKYCNVDPCALWCGSPTSGVYFGPTNDGTVCKLPSKAGICVAGTCVEVGCDYVLKSGEPRDRCGTCKGDGSTCRIVTGSNHTKYTSYGHWPVTTIPVHASNVLIQEGGATYNFLAATVGTNKNWAIPPRTYGKTVHLDGATIYYKLNGFPNRDKMTITGTLKTPVHIYYSNYFYRGASKGVSWHYTLTGMPEDRNSVKAKWTTGAYSACSKSCSGGVKTRDIFCIRKDDNSSIAMEVCNALSETKPESTAECETQNCPAKWHTFDWGACSQSCGTGTKTRKVACSELTTSGEKEVDEAKCTEAKPNHATTDKCNDFSCAAYWDTTTYSACSTKCGEGEGSATRTVDCKRLDKGNKLGSVPELECIAIHKTKPPTTTACNACPVWKEKYSACSVTCGAGTQTPSVICANSLVELPSDRCDQSTKPAIPQVKACNLGECGKRPFHWGIKKGTCTATCGKGVIKQEYVCLRTDKNREVELGLCGGERKPAIVTESCTMKPCPPSYQWEVKSTSCAIGCAKGSNIIEIRCIDGNTGNEFEHEQCAKLTAPSPNCKRNCRSVFKDTPDIYPLGCYKDVASDHRVPQLFSTFQGQFSRSDVKPTITSCAAAAKKNNFPFFALQSYGDCWIGDKDTVNTFDTAGKSTRCTMGTGKDDVNYVFHIGGPIAAVNIAPVVRHGCLLVKDINYSASAGLGLHRIVPICGLQAHALGAKYFGGDGEGNCLSSQITTDTMNSPQFARTCVPEKDGMRQYHIFTFVSQR